jgi:hypothetical protein
MAQIYVTGRGWQDGRVHPVAAALTAAACGTFPEADGSWARVTPWRRGVEGVVALTGHALLAVGDDVPDERLVALGADGFGGASNPRLVATLAGSGWIDVLDLVLVAHGCGSGRAVEGLVPRPDLDDHPRARLAARIRSGVTTFGYGAHDDRTVVTLGAGLGGLPEVGIELDPAQRHTGSEVLRAALGLVPVGDVVVAACAPGNARAVRAFLGAGFTPVGSVQLWLPERHA